MNQNKTAVSSYIVTTKVVRTKTEKEKFLNQYKKIKKIGEGPFAKIKLMIDSKTGKEYAMKKFNMFILRKKVKMSAKSGGQTKYTSQADEVGHEIQIMKKLNHPHIVTLHEIIEDSEEQKIYLIMDYCKFGDIAQWDYKKQIFKCVWSLKQIARFFKQAALGLQYMHSINIIHRDIKPQNILINEQKHTKLIDFGRSVQLTNTEQRLAGSEGTYHFMAPETLSEKIKGGFDGKKSDIWSLGVSLFSVVFGTIPFNAEFLVKLFQKIEKAQYSFPQKVTDQQQKFIPLIKQMLELDWDNRPTIKQVIEKLQQIEKSL